MRVEGRSVWGVLIFIAACAGGDSSSSAFSVSDSAGVRMVHNGGGAGPATGVTEILRIGVVDGDEAYQFDRVRAIAVANDGTLFVGNDGSGTVRVFTAHGDFVRSIGRRGRGPGELAGIEHVALLGDTAVAVARSADRQGVVFTRTGDLLYVPAAPTSDAVGYVFGAGPDGWIERATRFRFPGEGAPMAEAGADVYITGYLWPLDPETGPDTVGAVELKVFRTVVDPVQGPSMIPFGPYPSEGMDGAGRYLITRSADYRIERYAHGRLTDVITRDVAPVPLGDDVLEQLRAQIRTGEGTQPAEFIERQERSLEYLWSFNPPHLPPVSRILVATDGSFWVERRDHLDPLVWRKSYTEPGLEEGRPRWDRYDDEGRFLDQVELPEHFAAFAIRGNEVTGVLRDELDVEYVVVLRVTRSEG